MLHIQSYEEWLVRVERGGGGEIWEVVRTYRGVRRRADGGDREVRIEFQRRSNGEPYNATWRVVAEDDGGRRAVSETDSDLEVALETMPWHCLDEETSSR